MSHNSATISTTVTPANPAIILAPVTPISPARISIPTAPTNPTPSATKNPKKKIIVILALIVMIFITLMSVIIYFRGKAKIKQSSSELALEVKQKVKDSPISVTSEVMDLINKQENFPIFLKDDRCNMWWITEDDWSILNDDCFSISLKLPEIPNIINDAINPIAMQINRQIAKYFISKGFTKNIRNSSIDEEDLQFYDYIQAYEKDNLKCVVEVNGDHELDLLLSCADNFQTKYDQQLPYLKALFNYDPKIEKSSTVVHMIKTFDDDSFRAGIRFRRTGIWIIGKLIDGQPVIYLSGQGEPDCASLDKFMISRKYHECYEYEKNEIN